MINRKLNLSYSYKEETFDEYREEKRNRKKDKDSDIQDFLNLMTDDKSNLVEEFISNSSYAKASGFVLTKSNLMSKSIDILKKELYNYLGLSDVNFHQIKINNQVLDFDRFIESEINKRKAILNHL